ncbi:MAG: galactose mutarotase [Rhodobacteraceae bacterium]|nr:galactose mutarotase [Paracoccaceae bacterium]
MAEFGRTADGQRVDRITLRAGGLQVAVLTWGAVLQSVRLEGVSHDLTLGSEDLTGYEGALCYHGSIIAPVVNRLTNAAAPLGGKMLKFEVNFNGAHVLHSGLAGTQTKVWQVVQVNDSACTLALDLPDGEGGFPGNRHVEAKFEVAAPARLRLTITVHSDAATIWNAANHSYWNLDGSADFAGHVLTLAADHYLPATPEFIPTGEIRDVAGLFDFRKDRAVSPGNPDLDNCFCLSPAATDLRDVMNLRGQTGVEMTLATTEPGLQLYDCRHDGYKGLAVEAQGWPDAPNKPGFPGIALAAGETRAQITEWRFAKCRLQ